MLRVLEHLSCMQAGRAGGVQPRRREGSGETLQHLKGAYRRAVEGLFTGTGSDRTRGSGF